MFDTLTDQFGNILAASEVEESFESDINAVMAEVRTAPEADVNLKELSSSKIADRTLSAEDTYGSQSSLGIKGRQ